jgi:uncharacterized protein YbjT (DUF2867 family)
LKVIVFGAHSAVGEFVISKLREYGYPSCAVVGNQNQMELLMNRGADEVVVYEENSIQNLFRSYEAAIFLTGISPKAQTGKTVMVDHQSVIETVKEAERQGVKRFVMLSPVSANEAVGDESREIAAKEMPDEFLRQSTLTYTVVQPGTLNDKPGEGKIAAAVTLDSNTLEISREDLAEVLVTALNSESTYNKTFEVGAGETPITKALASL